MGLVADMQALVAAVGVEERDEAVAAKPSVGPRMVTGFQPSLLSPKWKKDPTTYELLEEAGWFNRIREGFEPREEAGGPAAPGFIPSAKLKRAPRNGLGGMPRTGRNSVSDSMYLLEERRPLLAFWTISLPTAALLAMNEADSWPVFTQRLFQKLKRRLIKELGQAVFVGVAENQPRRSLETGMPCPHLHIVFVGRCHRKAPWAISKAALDVMIKQAAQEAGLNEQVSFKSAGNVQPVKKSVRAYLTKYMTKGAGDVQRFAGGPYENLVPRQWWHWSEATRLLVRGCTVQLPTAFMCWIWRHRERLLAEGRLFLHKYELREGVPATYQARWGNAYKLSTLIADWLEYVDDELTTAKRELGIYTIWGQSHYAKPLGLDLSEPLNVFEGLL